LNELTSSGALGGERAPTVIFSQWTARRRVPRAVEHSGGRNEVKHFPDLPRWGGDLCDLKEGRTYGKRGKNGSAASASAEKQQLDE